MKILRKWFPPFCEFQQGYAFLDRAPGDAKEVFAIGNGEPPVALGDVGGDGERRSVELIDQEAVAAWKLLGELTDTVGEINRLLINDQLLESEE